MHKSSFVIASALTLVIGLSAGVRPASAQAAQSAPALTALDYFEIQQLVAKYARAIDTCSNNGYDYADLFAPDGYFAASVNGKIGGKNQGREKLAEVSGGGSRGCKNVGWIRQGVKHLYVNHIITPTATGASGSVDMLMIGLGGDPNKIRHEGIYEDTYTKTSNGWRFASRIHFVPEGGTAGGAGGGRGGQQGQGAGQGAAAPAAPAAPAPTPAPTPAR